MVTIKVVLVEDHPLFRLGLQKVLNAEEDIEVVEEIADGGKALERIRELTPEVVITDISLPRMNGLQIIQNLKKTHPEIAIIVLTAYHNEAQEFHSIRAGAFAYFSKYVTHQRLIETVREVNKGNYVIDGEVMDEQAVAKWIAGQSKLIPDLDGLHNRKFDMLTPREMEVLRHVAKGMSNKEIAYELGISPQTVKNHLTNIFRKLEVHDRIQAVIFAIEQGWIWIEGPDSEV